MQCSVFLLLSKKKKINTSSASQAQKIRNCEDKMKIGCVEEGKKSVIAR